MITPAEYFDRLERHDWFHQMADDHRAWERGQREERELVRIAAEHPELSALWTAAVNYHRPVNPDTGYLDTSLRDTVYSRPVRPDDARLCGQLSLPLPDNN